MEQRAKDCSFMAKIAPRPHVLLALVNQNIPWWKALAELVDNSFDAGASRVVINCSSRQRIVSVSDDGHGVKDVLALVTLGMHDELPTTTLGMYGIGAKDAWFSIADEMRVDTVRNGIRTQLSANWRNILKSNDFECDDPVSVPSDLPTGTTISFPLRKGRNQPSPDAFDRLRFIFTPALARGLQIVRTGDGNTKKALEPMKLPPLQEAVRAQFDLDGKHVEIDIGILPENERMMHGPFWLQYGHRIVDSCSLGAGQYSTLRVGGTITLGKGWTLTKNKDDLTEQNKSRLADAIFARIEGLLQKGERLAETIESQALRTALEAVLNESLRAKRKERRAKPAEPKPGTIIPVHTGHTRRKAAKTHDLPGQCEGDGISPVGRKTGFTLDWCDDEPNVIGKFECTGSRVLLNINHPFIRAAKATQNRIAFLSAAWVLIADYGATHKNTNKLLSFDWDSFAGAFSQLAMAYQGGAEDAKQAAG
jgi:hypothetical protein